MSKSELSLEEILKSWKKRGIEELEDARRKIRQELRYALPKEIPELKARLEKVQAILNLFRITFKNL